MELPKPELFKDLEEIQPVNCPLIPTPTYSTGNITSKSTSSIDTVSSKLTENAITCLVEDTVDDNTILSTDKVPSTESTNSEHSNLNELLLDLSEVFNGTSAVGGAVSLSSIPSTNSEISTLLDQSFTEDVVTPPLLSEIIQNGAFNPSHPDTLTDDDLENYLAELEKEEEEEEENETCHPVENVDNVDKANPTPSCLLEAVNLTEDKLNSIGSVVNKYTTEDVPLIDEGLNLPTPDTDITSAEESNESFDTDSDTEESQQSQLQEDSTSGDEEMPQLIDDPSLMNNVTEVTGETIVSQIISQHVEEQPELCSDNNPTESDQIIPSNNIGEVEANRNEEQATSLAEEVPHSSPEESISGGPSPASVTEFPQHEDLLEPYSSLTEEERLLGVLKPVWIPDEEAPQCMNCSQRFTVLRRRHHCRACGRVLCSGCCSSRARLEYMECKETRVCLPCLQVLRKVEAYKKWGTTTEGQAAVNALDSESQSSVESTPTSSPSPHVPNPVVRVNVNNPAEYCSTVPPALQVAAAAALPTPTVMVPVGVLKKEGTPSHPRTKSEPKQVIINIYHLGLMYSVY